MRMPPGISARWASRAVYFALTFGLYWLTSFVLEARNLRLGERARSLVRFGVEQKPRNGFVYRRRHARLYVADLT